MNTNCFVPYIQRVNTFKCWKGCVCAEKLARAGLLFTGVDDKTICTVCKHEMSGWTEDHDPWLVHYFKNPDCPFIILNSRCVQRAKNKVKIQNLLKKFNGRRSCSLRKISSD